MAVYIVKESFIYDGKIQNIGEEVQILEKDVIENCINRGLIEKKDSTAFGVSVPSKLADLLELKKGDEFISGDKVTTFTWNSLILRVLHC